MFLRNSLTWCALLAVMVLLMFVMTSIAQADVVLWNDEQITIDSPQDNVTLYDVSSAFIVSGGSISPYLRAYDSSIVDLSGGSINNLLSYGYSSLNISGGSTSLLYTYDSSSVNLSGGVVFSDFYAYNSCSVNMSGGVAYEDLRAYDSSIVNVSGGSVKWYLSARNYSTVNMSGGSVSGEIRAFDSGTVNLSGGSVSGDLRAYDSSKLNLSGGLINNNLHAYNSSTVTFNARDFRLGAGLTLDGERLLGTGILSGEWVDTTRWTINIAANSGAGIFISLVGVGDANCDGVVDEADASILADNWQTSTGATWREGDFNGDGGVDDADATMMAINWQQSAGGATVTIPEPGTLALLAGVIVVCMFRRNPALRPRLCLQRLRRSPQAGPGRKVVSMTVLKVKRTEDAGRRQAVFEPRKPGLTWGDL